MFLGNPMLPVLLPVDEALQKITKILEEKNWQEFEIDSTKLVLTPFFFYQYHYFIEEEKDSKKIIKETVDGYISLNANLLIINENVAKLIRNKIYEQHTTAPEIEFVEQEINVSKKEQEKLLIIKTAQHFSIPKENLVVSKIQQVLVPFYETYIKINSEKYFVRLNAVDGNIHGFDKIPEREKSVVEVTRETFDDLTSPSKWATYTKNLLIETKNSVINSTTKNVKEKSKKNIEIKNKIPKTLNLSFLESKWVLILIMILALMLIYLAFI